MGSIDKISQVDFMDLLDCVRPVGVDANTVHVGHDQQRRVLQCDGVLLKLGKGAVEVFLLALVFPREAAVLPDVRPAIAARCLGRTLLEGEPFPFRVGSHRVIDAEETAQIVEVGLRRTAFFQFNCTPLVDENLRGHRVTTYKHYGANKHGLTLWVNAQIVFATLGRNAKAPSDAPRAFD